MPLLDLYLHSAKNDKSVQNLLELCSPLLFHHFTNWNVQISVLLSLSTMIFKINTWLNKEMCSHYLVIVFFNSFERNKKFASITPDFHRELSCGLLQLRLNISSSWIQVAAVSSTGGWIQVTNESSSGGWI